MNKIAIVILLGIVLIGLAVAYIFLNPKINKNMGNPNSTDIQGMKVEVLKEGTGDAVENGMTVMAHYVGTLEDGTKFDSSIDRGQPFPFTLGVGQVIKGWDLGVVGMKVGEKRRLTIPGNLGYGENGIPGLIPSNSTLIFEVELISFTK
ncbi:MAG: FKBP-type peptidyl-prolyl cis-trans isomerase [Candidatus Staskawiczbacteria bacterium]|jgi:FKBP-type peptidyl-prolyl cis-trans isomerase